MPDDDIDNSDLPELPEIDDREPLQSNDDFYDESEEIEEMYVFYSDFSNESFNDLAKYLKTILDELILHDCDVQLNPTTHIQYVKDNYNTHHGLRYKNRILEDKYNIPSNYTGIFTGFSYMLGNNEYMFEPPSEMIKLNNSYLMWYSPNWKLLQRTQADRCNERL